MSTKVEETSLLSIAAIARHFALPESTARFYCKRFAAHIPSVGEGRRRRYPVAALEVIACVLEEMRHSRTAAQIELVLHEKFSGQPGVVSASPTLPVPPASAPVRPRQPSPSVIFDCLERQTRALEEILPLLRRLAERLPESPAVSAADWRVLQEEVRTLRTLLEACEKNQQADTEQIRRWIGKALRGQSPA